VDTIPKNVEQLVPAVALVHQRSFARCDFKGTLARHALAFGALKLRHPKWPHSAPVVIARNAKRFTLNVRLARRLGVGQGHDVVHFEFSIISNLSISSTPIKVL
jgi:hypothetical protein